MKVNYPSSSPYSVTPQTSWHIGRYRHVRIPPSAEDVPFEITAEYQYRPDKLSFHLYGTEAYWWVFMSRNLSVIRNPIWDFVAGTTIMIPSASHVRTVTGVK